MRPFSFLFATVAVISFIACGGGDTGTGVAPPTGPPPPTQPDDPDPPWCKSADSTCAVDNRSCDEDDDECGGCLPGYFLPDEAEDDDPCISEADLNPSVKILGVGIGPELTLQSELVCDNEMEIHVAAEQIGSKVLHLLIKSNVEALSGPDMFWLLTEEDGFPPAVETAPYHYSFALDGAMITEAYAQAARDARLEEAEEGQVVPDMLLGPALKSGEQLELVVVALTVDENGRPGGYLDENGIKISRSAATDAWSEPITLTMDMEAPTVFVTEPTDEFGTPTLSGETNIVGTVSDDEQISRIEVSFQGNLKEEIFPATDSGNLDFEVEIDLRYEASADFATLDVTGYDVCGHAGSIVDEEGNTGITTKVIAWPWIRTYDHRTIPEGPQIRDSVIADWDGDGYNEIVFATAKGVYLFHNGADGEDLDEDGWDPDAGSFSELEQLTTVPAAKLALGDLDADGDIDLLTIQDQAGAKVLALYRREASDDPSQADSLLLTETAAIPVAGTSQVVSLLLADFNNTTEEYRRDDVVIVTSGVGETLLLYKRYYDDEAPTAGDSGNGEGGEGEDDEPEVTLNPVLKEFDHCEDATVVFTPDPDAVAASSAGTDFDAADGGGPQVDAAVAEGDVSGTTEYLCDNPDKPELLLVGTRCCPRLFGEPIKSGSVKNATYAEAMDVTGPDGVPDGLLDVVMGADQANYIYVWENRFWNTGLLDTAFSDSTVNGVYPVYDGGHKARYFCSGDLIEEGSPTGLEESCDPEAPGYSFACHGHKDLVVGTEKSGTWRVLRGVGGGLYNNKKLGTDPEALGELFDMSGTVSADVAGMVCEDLNQDGHIDFAVLSSSARLMQVHLGNGTGRFNQVGESPYMNPVNEGIGFVVGTPPQNLRVGDLNGDGYPDIVMDYANAGFGIFMNTTHVDPETEQPVFDMHATRALVAPLGKGGASMAGTGGVLSAFTIGDITNDGKQDIVAVTDPNKSDQAKWLMDYHYLAREYRDWVNPIGKTQFANNVYVWSQQSHFNEDTPTFPASYDRHPPGIFQPNAPKYGLVKPTRIEVLDMLPKQAQAPPAPDGNPDLVFFGGAYSNPASAVSVLANVTNLGFWDMDVVPFYSGGTFRPHNGNADVDDIKDFVWTDPFGEGEIPSFVMGFKKTACDMPGCECTDLNATARQCTWFKGKKCDDNPLSEDQSLCPFWDCWVPPNCESSWQAEIGGGVVSMGKTSISEPDVGLPTDDPYANGDVMVLNSDTGTLSILTWKGPDKDYPFNPSWEKSVGEKPVYMDLGDMDNDGIVDVAATVKDNVMIAFGQAGAEPLEAFLPVDKDPEVQQKGGVGQLSLTDVNSDGRLDVVFLLTGYNEVVAYLGIGEDPDGSFTRQFHGPVRIPTCNQPSMLRVHDFNGDGCETLAVLCAGAGAVALLENDTCANTPSPEEEVEE